ncbi:MAG: DUF4838 domain-containing protein [Clostridia bacterium]|nr:DUF4838 domain-containing protein [Clostridia bacterium]
MANINQYKILLPKEPGFYEKFAKDELVRLLGEIGISLDTFSDDIIFSSNDKIISIGRTINFAESGLKAEYNELKRDGHIIKTQGNALYLVGGEGYGTVYAVYGFLARQFGYNYYAPDEVVFKNANNLEISDYDVTDIPDIENRTGANLSSEPIECATRFRTFHRYGFMQNGECYFGSWAHNHIKEYMPISKYHGAHPDWYSPEFTQLCLTNEEMWEEFVKNVIQKIKDKPDSEYFLLGQEDRPTFCGCDRCKEWEKKIGKSGIMMRFINHVAREVEKWRKENAPDRYIWIGTFAYQKTVKPPVVLDDNGKWVPVDSCVIPEKNVFVMLAPIGADMNAPLNDLERNAQTKENLDGWTSLTDNCILWTYGANFSRKFFYFDSFHVMAENYKIAKEYKFKWLLYEKRTYKGGTAFRDLSAYLHSNLAWNVNLSIHDLANDFMNNYYKDGASEMKEYMQKTDDYFKEKKKEISEKEGRYVGTYLWQNQETNNVWSPEFFSWEFISEMNGLLDRAVQKIKAHGYGEEEQKYVDRVEMERLSLKMITAEFFKEKFTKKEYHAFLDEFKNQLERLEIESIKTKQTLEQTINDWKEKY